MVGELFRQIADALKGRPCEVNISSFDVRLPGSGETDEQGTTGVQPDILVVCDPKKLDERGCRGALEWVDKVVSPQSAANEQSRKLAIYGVATILYHLVILTGPNRM